jgi:hypothetical protein
VRAPAVANLATLAMLAAAAAAATLPLLARACSPTYDPPPSESKVSCSSCCGPCPQTPVAARKCWKKDAPEQCRPCAPDDAKSLGCYADPTRDGQNMAALRTLSMNVDWSDGAARPYGPVNGGHTMNSAVLTFELCAKACGDAGGWGYFSVGDGQQCWCGSEINPDSKKVDDAKCNMPCTGDATKMCGGHWVSNVFELQCGNESCGAQSVSAFGTGWTFVMSCAILSTACVADCATVLIPG